MKKVIIGFAIFGTLIVYSLGVRHEQPKINTPVSLTSDAASSTANPGSSRGTAVSGNTPSPSSASTPATGAYKDGSYTGSIADAFYGNVQVRATIQGGRLTAVTFLDYPHTHSTSIDINQQAMPYLQQEAIKAQNAQVDIVSGATYTSQAFIQSLSRALSQAS